MDHHRLKSLEDTKTFLEQTGTPFKEISHDAVPTVKDMVEKVIFEEPTLLAKNLFLKDKKKGDLYLIVADHATEVDLKALAKHVGTKNGNLRGASEDLLMEKLGCKPGSVNLFSILNDTDEDVKLIIDQKVMDAELLGVHPMINTATYQINKVLRDYVIEMSGHEPDVIDFVELASKAAAAPVEKKQAKKAPKTKKKDVNRLAIEYGKGDDFAEWYT